MARFFRASFLSFFFIFSDPPVASFPPRDAGRQIQSEDSYRHALTLVPAPDPLPPPREFRRNSVVVAGPGRYILRGADATSRVYTRAMSRREETAGVGPRRNVVLIISRAVIYDTRPMTRVRFRDRGGRGHVACTRATSSRAHLRDQAHPHQPARLAAMMNAPVFELSPKRRRLMKFFRDGPRKLSPNAWRSEGGGSNESLLMIRLSETRDTQGALPSVSMKNSTSTRKPIKHNYRI